MRTKASKIIDLSVENSQLHFKLSTKALEIRQVEIREGVLKSKLEDAKAEARSLESKLDEAEKEVRKLRYANGGVVINPRAAVVSSHDILSSMPWHFDAGSFAGQIEAKLPKAPSRSELVETLLEDILTLEPQLKHYRHEKRSAWDFARVHRAAEHVRGIDAAASVGYSDGPTIDQPVVG